MRRAIRLFACLVGLSAMLCAPAVAAPANGQLAAVADGRLVTLNPDGSGLRTLPVSDPESITELSWSPGGNRLAFVRSGNIGVLELATGQVLSLTTEGADANIGWSSDGMQIGFRRGLFAMTVPAAGGDAQLLPLTLPAGTTQIAWKPNLQEPAMVVGDLLLIPLFKTPPPVMGAPAWSPDGATIAFANAGGLATIAAAGGELAPVVTTGPVGPPRWAPDSLALLYSAGTELRTVALAGGSPQVVLTASGVGATDWQHCSDNTASCVSVAPPRCSATTATATTQADQPVDLPPAPCTDPAGRALTIVVVKSPEHGSLTGLRYTPAAGFTGQDSATYRVSNGVAESESVRATIFVLARPVVLPAAKPPAAVRRAPFLSARATPRLDRRRRTLAQLSCDQDCSLVVRLTARLRSKRTLNGPQLRRSLAAGQVLSLRLRLPANPHGTVKTVWITGRVRNAVGDGRTVKLPVRLPR
jgi:Bacterial Ig domain/Dipeptidyl peptidase IV (DPP IV) N-terminal region/WD40-like Beta Propeller Repeat